MTRVDCTKSLLLALLPVVVMACVRSSNTPAIPPAREPQKSIQVAEFVLEKTHADSQRAGYFSANVLPIVAKCQPCHFKGGKMYAQLPFDDSKTIRRLGAHLFTRIQDSQEQAIIRAFLAQTEDSTKIANGVSVPH